MSQRDDNWPDYMPAPREQVFALGVISLNYGYLENVLRVLFSMTTQMNYEQATSLFPKIGNDVRIRIFQELLHGRTLPAELKEMLEYFVEGFGICAANRHAIMHSFHGGLDSKGDEINIVLSKYARSGELSAMLGSVTRLRAVADAIHEQSNFAIALILKFEQYLFLEKHKREAEFLQQPLPERPPLPEKLETHYQRENLNTSRRR